MLKLSLLDECLLQKKPRKGIENADPDLIDANVPDWSQDQARLSWVSELK